MNTSKFDTLAMAAETRAKMPVDDVVEARASEGVVGLKPMTVLEENSEGRSRQSSVDAAEAIVSPPPPTRIARPRNTRRCPTFAEKLHAILNDKSLNSIVTWLPSGKSFCIINKEAFTNIVLPKYFKESLFESFSRRLKRWGYRKVYTPGQKQIVIIHDLFQKGRIDLCKLMNGRASQSVKIINQDNASKQAEINEEMIQELALAEKSLQVHRSAKGATEEKKAPLVNPQLHQVPNRSQNHIAMTYPAAPVFINCAHNVITGTGNLAQQADLPVYQRHLGVRASVPYNAAPPTDVVRQLNSLDQEIEECQEQLAILQRLRTLRERRLAFY